MTTPQDHRQTLAELLAGSDRDVAAVWLAEPTDLVGVVVGSSDPSTVDVIVVGGELRSFPASHPAVRITNNDRKRDLIGYAVVNLHRQRLRRASEDAAAAQAHQHLLDSIRSYVIDLFEDGAPYTLTDLNDFLSAFDLPEYRPQLVITLAVGAEDDDDGRTAVDVGPISLDIAGWQRFASTTERVPLVVESAHIVEERPNTAAPPSGDTGRPRFDRQVRTAMVATADPSVLTAVAVLSTVDRVWMEVIGQAGLSRLPRRAVVRWVNDSLGSTPVLATALAYLVRLRGEEEQQRHQARDARARTMAEIRRYAIARYREGLYCLDGLNAFLHTFHLSAYDDE
jgi:hypothetical protein